MIGTTNIKLIAYFIFKGYQINSYEFLENGKKKVNFDLTKEKFNELKLEFANSDICKYMSRYEDVKDLFKE